MKSECYLKEIVGEEYSNSNQFSLTGPISEVTNFTMPAKLIHSLVLIVGTLGEYLSITSVNEKTF